VSLLESLRRHLVNFTLSSAIEEILHWSDAGRSCFAKLLAELNLPPPITSLLDQLLPVPSG
jgi:hypothetical protein